MVLIKCYFVQGKYNHMMSNFSLFKDYYYMV